MSTDETQPYDRLGEALLEYELAREQGKAPDRGAFLARYADLADQLRPLFDAVPRIEQLLCPLRESLAGKPPLAVPTIKGYEILEEIGRGGMGVVYKARHLALNSIVALKLLRPDWLASLDGPTRRGAIELFRDEARKARRLEHPNRVHILDVKEDKGRPFIVMEFIQGCTLADMLKRPGGVSKESKQSVVKYLISIAEAVQDAHEHFILHRDIKPRNILIDERTDEANAAKLTDFGLAMDAPSDVVPAEQSVRVQKRVAGTFPYMSPEHTQNADCCTVRSDVYSLGATLYEALTGTPPFTGASPTELFDKIRHCEPDPPRRHNPNIDPELERICLKCLHKAPEQRYASAHELAEALRKFDCDLQYLRNFTKSWTLLLVWGPITLIINLVLYWMLQGSFWEPVVWLLIFSGYLPVCHALLRAMRLPRRRGGLDRREYVSLWAGHFIATTLIAVALRTGLAVPARDVMLLMYPVFAALNGWLYFMEASRMPWRHSWGPVGYWLVAVVMLFHREAAPIYYGVYHALASLAYGLYLRKLARQLG